MTETNPTVEAKGTTSRMTTIRLLLNKAEGAQTDQERDAYVTKAAELMAKYGIDEAMLAEATGTDKTDVVVDRVIWTDRPFSKQMARLLWYIAEPQGAQARSVKEHTGNTQVGQLKWRHGLRVFAHEADLQLIELMYAAARNLALAGASKIRGLQEFGQDQKAHRESYIEGFSDGVYTQMVAAQREAQRVAEAEREQRQEQALLRGEITSGRSVALVLASRREVVKNAYDLAVYGMSSAQRQARDADREARWAEQSRLAQERWEALVKEQHECERCHNAKSGYCNRHRDFRPSQARTYERVGSYYDDGYSDGREANLSVRDRIEANRASAIEGGA